MTTINPETGDILSQLKTFKTLCAAFSAQVRELVRELNGEYGLWYTGCQTMPTISPAHRLKTQFLSCPFVRSLTVPNKREHR